VKKWGYAGEVRQLLVFIDLKKACDSGKRVVLCCDRAECDTAARETGWAN
jgi:hypothetical protein